MKILWLTNIPLPEACILLHEKSIPYGGWLDRTSHILSSQSNIELSVAFPNNREGKIQNFKGEKIQYYSFNALRIGDVDSLEVNKAFESILTLSKPDIVHIFGTEYPHSLAMVKMCIKMNIKTVISIQGLVSIISKHYMGSLPYRVQRRFTFRDFIKQDNLKQQQKSFQARGELEIEAIKSVRHVIGRTTWDKACTTQINPHIKYHLCNETLREEFYKHEWDIEECERYSIFISQAAYPIKGLHFMLEAMPLILKKFPNTKLYIAGFNIIKSDNLIEKLKKSSYSTYIIELINQHSLKDKVTFTGLLDEKQMCNMFLKSNVFVSASTIENESNSLSEAKILGVPSVASYVGGVTDRIVHNEDGFLYQAEATYMLAYYVSKIFEDNDLAKRISRNSRANALKLHDKDDNIKSLIRIYEDIFNEQY